MITDLRSLPPATELSADVCIVGSGPAGLALALALSTSRYRVLVLEAGGFEPDPAAQALYAGQAVGRNYPLMTSRLRAFGGTTGLWMGQCGVLPARHLAPRPWVDPLGWPFGADALTAYYQKAGRLLELGQVDPEIAEGVRGRRMPRPSAAGPLAPWVWRQRAGGPLRMGTQLRRDVEQAANVQVVLHANVTRLTTNETASRVTELQVASLEGPGAIARARYIVLACGGLENPRLLLNADDVQSGGLGNGRGLVGRYFMEHPNGTIGTLHLTDRKAADTISVFADYIRDLESPAGAWKPALCLGARFEQEQKVNAGYYRLRGRPAQWEHEWAAWRGNDTFGQLRVIARLFDERLYGAYRESYGYPISAGEFDDSQARVFVEFEQAPNPDSRVTLAADRDRLGLRRLVLDWRLSAQDVRTARALGEALGREAYLSGWGRFQFDDWMQETGLERSSRFGISWHHMGTTRMATDPQFGVVDPAGRVFGCDNLYVAGSSVFPSASFVNPTWTIVALSYRLADTLKARLDSSSA